MPWRGAPAPTTGEVESLVEAIARRVEAWLVRHGFGPEDGGDDDDDTQGVLQAAAVAGGSAFEVRRRTQRLGGREVELPRQCAAYEGYTLHAGVAIGAKDRGASSGCAGTCCVRR